MRKGMTSLVALLVVLLSLGLVSPAAYADDAPVEDVAVVATDPPADVASEPPADDSAPPPADEPAPPTEDVQESAPPPADVIVETEPVVVTETTTEVSTDSVAPVETTVSTEAASDQGSTAPPADAAALPTEESAEPAGDAEVAALALEGEEGQDIEVLSLGEATVEPEMGAALAAITEGEPAANVSIALLPGLVTSSDTPENVVAVLVGTGITYQNINYVGAADALGKFTGGTGIIGFEDGIIMGSGNINDVVGPNVQDGITTENGQPGDADLDALVAGGTQDAAVLTFDFVPSGNKVQFEYVFASDEYNEYVGSQYNDVFAFFINGANCAPSMAAVSPSTRSMAHPIPRSTATMIWVTVAARSTPRWMA